ncbi:BA3454 family stress response protein [Neobacillus niacini]
MIEVTVKLNFKGKNYLTNVIVGKDTSEKQILQMAREQVTRQWTN